MRNSSRTAPPLRDHLDSYRISLQLLARDRYEMAAELHQVPGMMVFPSQANFLLVKLPPGADGGLLRDHLLSQHGVLVRECGNKLGITSQFVRLVVRPRADVQRLLTGLYGYLGLQVGTVSEASSLIGDYPDTGSLGLRHLEPVASGPRFPPLEAAASQRFQSFPNELPGSNLR